MAKQTKGSDSGASNTKDTESAGVRTPPRTEGSSPVAPVRDDNSPSDLDIDPDKALAAAADVNNSARGQSGASSGAVSNLAAEATQDESMTPEQLASSKQPKAPEVALEVPKSEPATLEEKFDDTEPAPEGEVPPIEKP